MSRFLLDKRILIKNVMIIVNGLLSCILLTFIIIDAGSLNVIKYLFYIAFYLIIPGFAILIWVNNKRSVSGLPVNIVLSLTIGLIIEILLYIILSAVGVLILMRIYPIFFLASIFFAKTNINLIKRNVYSLTSSLCLEKITVWLLILLFSWLYVTKTISKPIMESIIYGDLVWGLGNIKEMINNFPWMNPHALSGSFRYHHFVFIHNASATINSTVPADIVYLKIDPVLIISIVFFLINRISGLVISRWYLALTPIWLVGFIPAIFPFMSMDISDYLTLSPTYAFSYIFLLSTIYLIIFNIKLTFKNIVIFILLFLGAMGSKGSAGVILLGGFYISCLYHYNTKSDLKKHLLISAILTVVFIIQYFLQFYPKTSTANILPNAQMDYLRLFQSFIFQLSDVRIYSLILFGWFIINKTKAKSLVFFALSALAWIFLIPHYEGIPSWDKFYFYSYSVIPISILFVFIMLENTLISQKWLTYLKHLILAPLLMIPLLLSVRNVVYDLKKAVYDFNGSNYCTAENYRFSDSEIDLVHFMSEIKGKYSYYYLDDKKYHNNPNSPSVTDRKYLNLCYKITAYGEIRRVSTENIIENEIELPEILIYHKQKSCLILFSDVKPIIDNRIIYKDIVIIYENDSFIVYSYK